MGLKLFFGIFLSVGWLLSGFVINFFQLVNRLIVYPINKNVYRKLNGICINGLWVQLMALVHYFSGGRVRIFYKDQESLKMFGTQHTFCLVNHTYQLDWLFTTLFFFKLGVFNGVKAMAKNAIKYFPIFGWSGYFSEFIFLARDWKKDEKTLAKSLNNYMTFEDPTMTVVYCEGTRRTDTKMKAAKEYAETVGVEPFKHHLYPRTRGINYCLSHLEQQVQSVYNIQMTFPSGQNKEFSMEEVLRGEPMEAHIYLERVSLYGVKREEAELNKFVLDVYRQKDKLMDYHQENNKFPGQELVSSVPITWFLHFMFWQTIVAYCYMHVIFVVGGTWAYVLISFWVFGLLTIKLLLKESSSSHSSTYGSTAVVHSHHDSPAKATKSTADNNNSEITKNG